MRATNRGTEGGLAARAGGLPISNVERPGQSDHYSGPLAQLVRAFDS